MVRPQVETVPPEIVLKEELCEVQGMSRPRCPICKDKKLVPAAGPEDADVLLAGPFPGWEEIKDGIPWVGNAGKVLRAELGRSGIQFDKCRVTNLWQHEPSPTGTKRNPNPIYEDEINWHFDQLRSEFNGRTTVLLLGSLTTEILGLGPVSKVAGTRVHSEYFPKTVEVVIAAYNPAQVLHGLVGETRYAIEAFADAIGELNDS